MSGPLQYLERSVVLDSGLGLLAYCGKPDGVFDSLEFRKQCTRQVKGLGQRQELLGEVFPRQDEGSLICLISLILIACDFPD